MKLYDLDSYNNPTIDTTEADEAEKEEFVRLTGIGNRSNRRKISL